MIPRRFDLFGRTVRVRKAKKRSFVDADTYGHWDSSKFEIVIQEGLNPDVEAQTFYHEFMHAALDALGYSDLSSNEQFVDQMGSMIHQMLKTSRQ